MFSEVCDQYVVGEIISLIIDVIVTILIVIISIIALYFMRNYHINSKPFPKLLYIPQIIFYLSNILFVIFYLITNISICVYNLIEIIWVLMVLFYATHWFSLLTLLFFRLYFIFEQTAFKISISFKIIIGVLVSVDVILLLITIYSGVIQHDENINLVSAAAAIFLAIFNSQLLAFTFVYKLYKVNKMQEETQIGLISMMTKYTIIAIISVSMSTLTVLLMTIQGFVVTSTSPSFRIWEIFVWKGFLFDVLIDSCSTSLSFQFYRDYYHRICGFCDIRCKRFCIFIVSENKKEDNEHSPPSPKQINKLTSNSDNENLNDFVD